MEIVKYLISEIEEEIEYKKQYEIEKAKAEKQAEQYNKNDPEKGNKWHCSKSYYDYMPDAFRDDPKKSITKVNAMLIRRIMLKLYNRDFIEKAQN